MIERLIITLTESGAIHGISTRDHGGKSVAATVENLAAIAPAFNTAALAEIDRLKAEITTLQTQHAEALATALGQPRPGAISKLTLMRRLQALGKWTTFKGLLGMLDPEVQDAWSLAQEISPDDPLFVANATTLKTALALTEAQWLELLTP